MTSALLGSLCYFQAGSAFPQDQQGGGSGMPFVKVSDLASSTNGKYLTSANNHITDQQRSELKVKPVAAGSIIFAKIGEGLRAERFRVATQETAIDNNLMAAIPRRGRCEPGFLYYLLSDLGIARFAHGSALPYLRQSDLQGAVCDVPPLPTQRAIAEVLGALDDKIAANANVGAAADALVRELFARFVDCPDSIAIHALATNPREAARPPFEPDHYVGLEHVPRRSMWLSEGGDVDGLASAKFVFARDDVLFGKLRPYFHKVVVSDRSGICSTDILTIRARRTSQRGFVWAALTSDAVVQRVSAMSEGTRMPRTRWSDVASTEVPWPGEHEVERFSTEVVAWRDRVSAAIVESRHLATLRDTLLPHLMSGRLTVREAEQRVEEVL